MSCRIIRSTVRSQIQREAKYGIAPDHDLERIEGAAERSAKRAGDPGGGSAADQNAQIAAAQPQRLPDPRRYRACELGVAGLEPDRGADAARPRRLARDDKAPGERHAPAMQRIGFDRVDLAARPFARDHRRNQTETEPAQQRNGQGQRRIERGLGGQRFAWAKGEEQPVQQQHGFAHGGHDQTAEHADYGGKDEKA